MKNLKIHSNIREYQAEFIDNLDILSELAKDVHTFFIIDKNVSEKHPEINDHIKDSNLFLFEAHEENKTLDYAANIYDFLIEARAKKNITIVSIGGGITQDVTGFIASTLYRGVKWIFFPTTFLAMTDSCIGSKTSINYKSSKNLLGSFYPPHTIYMYANFLKTLAKTDFYSGIGESIKLQLMKEEGRLSIDEIILKIEELKSDLSLVNDMLLDNLAVKIGYIANDEFDQGRRNLLNYGHCLGHALETTSKYYVPHGIAVNIGMIYANFLSVNRGIIDKKIANKMNNDLFMPNIPIELRQQDFDEAELLAALKKDKKRIGKDLTSVIPDENFDLIIVNDITESEFLSSINELKEFLFN